MVLKLLNKNYVKKFLLFSYFISGLLFGMDQKYKVNRAEIKVSGSDKPKHSILVSTAQKTVTGFVSDVPIKSWEWDKDGKPILHMTLQNNEVHSFEIEQ